MRVRLHQAQRYLLQYLRTIEAKLINTEPEREEKKGVGYWNLQQALSSVVGRRGRLSWATGQVARAAIGPRDPPRQSVFLCFAADKTIIIAY